MPATTTTPALHNIGQATADQLTRFLIISTTRGDRVMWAMIDNGHLKIIWRTSAGYYIRAQFDQYGNEQMRQVFRNWNETENEPCNLLIIE